MYSFLINFYMGSIIFSKSFKDYINKCDNTISVHLSEYNKYGYFNEYFTNKYIDYITFRKDGTISYLPAGKEHIVDEHDTEIWKMDNRQNAKSSAALRKIVTKEALELFTDKDFENFTNCYKSEFNDDGLEFKLRPNTDVTTVYRETRIEGDCNLQGSCMNNEDYFEMYESCKNLQILALYNKDNLLCGRALIWSLEDGITLMDRIYVGKDFYTELFIEFAKSNKWWRKQKQSYESKTSFINDNEECVEKYFTIKLDTTFDAYPYIDTFTYGEYGSISNKSGFGCSTYEYTCTDGCRTGDDDNNNNTTYDEIDDRDIDDEDAVEINRGSRSGQYTHIDNAVQLNDNWYWNQDDLICEVNDEYCLKEDCVYDDIDQEWIDTSDVIFIDRGDKSGYDTHYENTIECINGYDWYKNDSNIIEINCKFYDKTNAENIVEINGEYYLVDSEEAEQALEQLKEKEYV